MIKDKLDSCAENSNNINIKDENTPSCDSTSNDSGGNENTMSKKDEDAGSSSATPTTKESPGSRTCSNPSSTPTRPTNSSSNPNVGISTNSNNSSTPNSICPPAGSGNDPDVGNILDNGQQTPSLPLTDIVPGGTSPPDDPINDRTSNTGLPPDLQTDTFNELTAMTSGPPGPSGMNPGLRPMGVPGMQQPHHGIRPSPNGIKPLVSNIINKPTGPPGGMPGNNTGNNGTGSASNMEVQYMQQQSQIFVFSTMLANKSAEAVSQGHFQSIIAYHCAQPGTKKYFEKHPLKLTQFNRQSPAQWLNGLAMMKNKNCVRGGMPGNMPGPQQMPPNMMPMGGKPPQPPGPPGAMGLVDPFPGHDAIVDDIASTLQETDVPWEQQRTPGGSHPMTGSEPPSTVPPAAGAELTDGPALDDCPGPGMLGHSPCIPSTGPSTSPSLACLEPSLQGVKVPDENLTPQQRQHREEQLATLRKMQQILFPEENATGMEDHEMVPNPDGPAPACQGGIMSAGHMEWQKLQNQFYDGKLKPDGQPPPNSTLRGPPQSNSGSVLSPQVPPPNGPGPRLQGPPPPYHQTPRSASVPIALQSPSPASPNNPTSNLSLPSPRTSSALNSPADSNNRQQQQPPSFAGINNRHFNATQSPTSQSSPSAPRGGNTVSNPGTPISSHFSPSAPTPTADSMSAQPGSTGPSTEFQGNAPVVTSSHHGVDGMFCRTLQSIAQKQHMVSGVPPGSTDISGSPNKEPNLMPVPSPQQIQYCNTFEGQELTIQKQPNTSLKDRNITSPASLDSGFPGEMCSGGNGGARGSAPNTPSSVDMTPRFPPNDCYRLPAPSPNSIDSKRPSPQGGNRSGGGGGNDNRPPPPSDQMRFGNSSPLDNHNNRYPPMMGVGSPNPFQAGPNGGNNNNKPPNMMAVSPGGKSVDPNNGQRADNVPLNPNNGLPVNPKGSHFDPISSLAQMSQLLTSTSSMNGQPPGGGGPSMMPYGGVNASPMDMVGGRPDMGSGMPDMDNGMMGGMGGPPHLYGGPGGIGSPKNLPFMSPQRIMTRPNVMGGQMPPYNGTSVQVKASAPNTIQYLPARPQMGPTNPRAPPSLDFLRFANTDGKLGGQNMQYFPGCPPNNNMGGPPPHMVDGGMHQENLMASLMNGPMMGKMGGGMSGGMIAPQCMIPMGMSGGPMRGSIRGPGPVNMQNANIRMHSMAFDQQDMYPPGPNGPTGPPQMFGGKGGMGRGMCAPDASQPLPPSVGQANAYKSSPFGGATTADPNYAQQFHNFQQQLYATSTRSQLNSQGPGPPGPQNQSAPTSNHMYFMSK